MIRPSWDEYFMLYAKLAASRSTCLAFPVGAVIVKDRQILATGYNGPPSGLPHCTEQGFCYEGLSVCGSGSPLPSRAIHAETNAIAQAAKHGLSTEGASIYVTLEPCLHCLKLIVSSGIKRVYFERRLDESKPVDPVTFSYYCRDLFEREQIKIRPEVASAVGISLNRPTSIRDDCYKRVNHATVSID